MGRFSWPRLLYTTTTVPSPFIASTSHLRHLSSLNLSRFKYSKEPLERLRHIWISGLIDPNKVDPTERSMLYTGQMPTTVVDKDDDLSRRNIHTQAAAAITSFNWKHAKINVIDTPARFDEFTVEVERALQAFDSGAIHVLSSVDGVQSQSITVDKQMIRYKHPRLIFVNNLDHKGANPWQVIDQARSKLDGYSAAVQVPIGLEDDFKGLVDLVQLKAYYFHGEKVVVEEVPAHMEALVLEKRRELIETVAPVDWDISAAFCSDRPISATDLQEAIRRATIRRSFTPIFMGSAFKYKGLQLLLDGVLNYLPRPVVTSNALVESKDGEKHHALVALAFTLKMKYGQITYLRIYEGVIRKGDFITNVNTGKTFEVPHLYQRRNDELEVIPEARAGEIVALYERCIDDVDYASGYFFTDGFVRYTITSKNISESISKDSIDASESVSGDSEVQDSKGLKLSDFDLADIGCIYASCEFGIEDYINHARSFEKHFEREDSTFDARV